MTPLLSQAPTASARTFQQRFLYAQVSLVIRHSCRCYREDMAITKEVIRGKKKKRKGLFKAETLGKNLQRM